MDGWRSRRRWRRRAVRLRAKAALLLADAEQLERRADSDQAWARIALMVPR